ncbi:hypothetical protein [Actinoplanes sp. DH11]|uniref:hypothetical protein n=1 Tax=Actinoplanes sp. DH11 TaxID=2857011 RepID=UPI001E441C93|nr:hypothetical protein [Actinoplanes sp. DH11]
MNDTHPRRRNPRPGRARKRAIREQAARTGVPYSVAARVIAELGLQPGESIASHGRTLYPGEALRDVSERRRHRTFAERLADSRRAAVLPEGRAQHLVERFPPCHGRPGSGVGRLYDGDGRAELLTVLYLAVAVESPGLVPEPGDLAWIAEMGEETALDMECALLDREARSLVEGSPADLFPHLRRVASELSCLAAPSPPPAPSPDGTGQLSDWLARVLASAAAAPEQRIRLPAEGVRQILDAVLMVADDGHAPGTRVRLLAGPHQSRTGTITGAVWGAAGPPVAYRVQLDGRSGTLGMAAGELIVLAGQESPSH